MSQVHWSMGQVLLPEHFISQQKYMHQLSGHVNSLAHSYSDGVLDVIIDDKALLYNILKIKKLAIFMPGQIFALLDFNAICHAYELDPDKITENGKLSLYLTLKNDPNIQHKSINQQDIEVEYFEFYLSDTLVTNTDYSVKLFELIYSEDEQKWSIDTTYIPKCIYLPYIFAKPFLKLAIEKLSDIKDKLHTICINKTLYDKYQSVNLKLSEIEFWLNLQNIDNCSISISELRNYIYQLYQCVSIVIYNKTSLYEPSKQPLQDCNKLLELLNNCEETELKSSSIYELSYKQGVYQTGILNDDFFTSESKYLVYNSGVLAASLDRKILVKGFAPSKAESILLKSLPGIELKPIESEILLDSFPDAEAVFEIIPLGNQWQAVVNERILCLKFNIMHNPQSQVYLTCS
ncbi:MULTISPECIES: type VI secretion system baseplate subunit TssK [unclassified Francisella]|uniref:type VI secretion system baseplate subunit TssK n=1 Tax=unclassified Francisella TaxID=2610885 RepID=UPI002E3277A0|nr:MULTISPECIES: type VI secretion system baseplate subunit TssK [unclassified Francisella]MED7818903.1 type VI secretion system baseplate subunit TssK [Francisella sp. 19S2-4]MED7829740.1 type VI secretion system baseplate subunit TssK [Francisella sp. 19S2-10]